MGKETERGDGGEKFGKRWEWGGAWFGKRWGRGGRGCCCLMGISRIRPQFHYSGIDPRVTGGGREGGVGGEEGHEFLLLRCAPCL